MLAIRTTAQIRNAQGIKGFRACVTSTGVRGPTLENRRARRAEAARAGREARRRWLAEGWAAHEARVQARGGGRTRGPLAGSRIAPGAESGEAYR